jgi:hypothetical protein
MLKKILKVAVMFTAVLTVAVMFAACGKKNNNNSNENGEENDTNGAVTLVSSAPITQEQLSSIVNNADLVNADLWQGLSVSLSWKIGNDRSNLFADTWITAVYDKDGNVMIDVPEIGKLYYSNANSVAYINIGDIKVYTDTEQFLGTKLPLLGDLFGQAGGETAGGEIEINADMLGQIIEMTGAVLKSYSDGTAVLSLQINGADMMDMMAAADYTEYQGSILPLSVTESETYVLDGSVLGYTDGGYFYFSSNEKDSVTEEEDPFAAKYAAMLSNIKTAFDIHLSAAGAVTKIELSTENEVAADVFGVGIYEKTVITLTPYAAAAVFDFNAAEYKDIAEFIQFIEEKYTDDNGTGALLDIKEEIYNGLTGREINLIEGLLLNDGETEITLPDEVIIRKIIAGIKRYMDSVWAEFAA